MWKKCRVCGCNNNFPAKGKAFLKGELLYPDYCPDLQWIKQELAVMEECKNCGYVFGCIDEDTGRTREMVEAEWYRLPFGREYSGGWEEVKCYRIALTYQALDRYGLAAKWYIAAAVLLGQGEISEGQKELQQKAYRKAVIMLKQKAETGSGSNHFEIMLAYLNVMRLARMYTCVQEVGMHRKIRRKAKCVGLDKRLWEVVLELAEQERDDYLTYYEMLFVEERRM